MEGVVKAWEIMADRSDIFGSAVDVLFDGVVAGGVGSSGLVARSPDAAADSLASDATNAEIDRVGGWIFEFEIAGCAGAVCC